MERYWAELLLSAAIVLAVMFLLGLLPTASETGLLPTAPQTGRRRWRALNEKKTYLGLITGADNRYSTSKAVALTWTLVVAWMVLSSAFAAAFYHLHAGTVPKAESKFVYLLSGTSDLYFVFLGGPYAAAAFARISVTSKIDQGQLAKPKGTPSAGDLISDDNGNPDVPDFQYVLFNILAMVIVAVSFAAGPGHHGLPDVPDFLAILTGGSALTYTVSKASATDVPAITAVTPAAARIGDIITVTGVQLFSGAPGIAPPTVTLAGVPATDIDSSSGPPNTLTAMVPAAPPGTNRMQGAVAVTVIQAPAAPVVARGLLEIVADQSEIKSVKPTTITDGTDITVKGTFLLAPGPQQGTTATGITSAGGVKPSLAVNGNDWPVTIKGDYSNNQLTVHVGPRPGTIPDPAANADKANFTLAREDGTAVGDPQQLTYAAPPSAP